MICNIGRAFLVMLTQLRYRIPYPNAVGRKVRDGTHKCNVSQVFRYKDVPRFNQNIGCNRYLQEYALSIIVIDSSYSCLHRLLALPGTCCSWSNALR